MILTEDYIINASKKAYLKLSSKAQIAISQWEAHNWIGGDLEKAIISNNDIAKEIYDCFESVRKMFKTDFIKLYRGERTNRDIDLDSKKKLWSWTSDRKVAEHFAGWRNVDFETLYKQPITHEQIKTVIDDIKFKGYAEFRNRIYS